MTFLRATILVHLQFSEPIHFSPFSLNHFQQTNQSEYLSTKTLFLQTPFSTSPFFLYKLPSPSATPFLNQPTNFSPPCRYNVPSPSNLLFMNSPQYDIHLANMLVFSGLIFEFDDEVPYVSYFFFLFIMAQFRILPLPES